MAMLPQDAVERLLTYFQERDARRERERWLRQHAYDDPFQADFGLNFRTRRLLAESEAQRDPQTAAAVARQPLAVLVALPDPPWSDLFSLRQDDLWAWLTPNSRRYAPDPGGLFLRGEPKPMLDGILVDEPGYGESPSRSYVALERHGVVELGLGERGWRPYSGRVVYNLTPIVGYLWQFLGFATDLYTTFGQQQPFTLVICLRATKGAWLGAVGAGWAEPYGEMGIDTYRPECLQPNILIRRDGLGPTLAPDAIADLTQDVATSLDNAWQQRVPRCYIHSNRDPATPFDLGVFQRYVRS